LAKHYGNFETAVDAVREALVPSLCWLEPGMSDGPVGWLIRVAFRTE